MSNFYRPFDESIALIVEFEEKKKRSKITRGSRHLSGATTDQL